MGNPLPSPTLFTDCQKNSGPAFCAFREITDEIPVSERVYQHYSLAPQLRLRLPSIIFFFTATTFQTSAAM